MVQLNFFFASLSMSGNVCIRTTSPLGLTLGLQVYVVCRQIHKKESKKEDDCTSLRATAEESPLLSWLFQISQQLSQVSHSFSSIHSDTY